MIVYMCSVQSMTCETIDSDSLVSLCECVYTNMLTCDLHIVKFDIIQVT